MSLTDTYAAGPATNVSKVSIKPPPFWKINRFSLFVQIEAQFIIAGISPDRTKFYTVISAIEFDILSSISDIFSHPALTEIHIKHGLLRSIQRVRYEKLANCYRVLSVETCFIRNY